jgi:hypothetical protein
VLPPAVASADYLPFLLAGFRAAFGVVFDGSMGNGATATVGFTEGVMQIGFDLHPNGANDANNTPEPELFFTNRFYDDIGSDGRGSLDARVDADPHCLILDTSHSRATRTRP